MAGSLSFPPGPDGVPGRKRVDDDPMQDGTDGGALTVGVPRGPVPTGEYRS